MGEESEAAAAQSPEQPEPEEGEGEIGEVAISEELFADLARARVPAERHREGVRRA